MTNIALVNPKPDADPWRLGKHPRAMEHVLIRHGLAQLSAVLKAADRHVTLLDLRQLSGWPEYENKLGRTNADFVCVTAHTAEAGVALEALRRAKRTLPQCTTVAGGIHWTLYPDAAVADGTADFVLRGEGEIDLPLLTANPSSFSNVFWGESPDLDSLPFEDRDLWPGYKTSLYFPAWDLRPPVVDMLTGRGCPWNCRFCCGPGEQNLFTRKNPHRPQERIANVRRRSTDHVIDELRQLFQKYSFKGIVFHDDQFLISPDWVIDFCRKMHRTGFPGKEVRWWAACRADMICRHPQILREMQRAGLSIISIGFESFSDPILQWMNKGVDSATNFKAAEICRDLGLSIYANVMFGIPREDGRWRLEDDLATIRALASIRPRFVSPSYLNPIPGSWFWNWFEERGLVLNGSLAETGMRTPDRRPLRGIDYAKLDALLAKVRKTYAEPWKDRWRYYRYRLQTIRMKSSGK